MKAYSHYIFDLYGTLLDIETDERPAAFWRFLAGLYQAYGCAWTGPAIQAAYLRMCAEEETALRSAANPWPEIRLERVFVRLLLECPKRYPCVGHIGGSSVENLCLQYEASPESVIDALMQSEWVYAIANAFRVRSRKRLRTYKSTLPVLHALQGAGKGVYLLSNAQAIFTLPELEQTGLLPCFRKIYISSDYGTKKPHAAFLQRLMNEEGLAPEACVMVGNEPESDISVARACGVDSVYLNTAHAPEAQCREKLLAISPAGKTQLILSGDLKELL